MRISFQKAIALLMLITFVMGMGFYGANPRWLAHEMDHDQIALLGAVADHGHPALVDVHAQHDENEEPFSDVEHKLLHAMSHGAQVPCSWQLPVAASVEEAVTLHIVIFPLRAVLDPLFRPPRTTSLI